MHVIDFKTSGYFSLPILIVGAALAFLGLAMVNISIIGALTCLFLGIVILTTHYRLRVDFEQKTFHDYVWILGLKNGTKGRFEQVDYIFIKPSKIRQTLNSRVSSTVIHKEVFDAYLRFSEHDKIHLLTLDDKKAVMNKATIFAAKLGVKVVDYTSVDS